VNQDVQYAEFLFGFVEQTVQIIQIAHVRLDEQGAAP
jgi:hypothetical protein